MQYLTIEIKLGTIYQDQKHLETINILLTDYLVIAESKEIFSQEMLKSSCMSYSFALSYLEQRTFFKNVFIVMHISLQSVKTHVFSHYFQQVAVIAGNLDLANVIQRHKPDDVGKSQFYVFSPLFSEVLLKHGLRPKLGSE